MKFKIKTNLSEYGAADLAAAISEGESLLDGLFSIEAPTAEDVAEAREVSAAVDSLIAERDGREPEVDAVTEMAALRDSRVTASDESNVEDEEGEAEEDEAEDEEDEPVEAAVEPVVAAAVATPKAPAKRKSLAGRRPATPPPAEPKVTVITASADVPGFVTGGKIEDLNGVAEAVIARAKSFPSAPMGAPGGALQRYGVALLHREHQFTANGNDADDYATIMEAAKESRLDGGNLIAAGGWCAPSETLYDLCDGETTDGLIDLPEVGWSRGGIRFTEGPQFAELYAAGFTQTEAQAIAGTTKPCYTITCPTWSEVRLDAMGICIKVPLLTNAGFPELTRRVISGSLTAHLHRVSAGLITKMNTIAGAAVAAGTVGSIGSNALNAVGLIATTIRQEYRLGQNETLEVVAPHWLREAMRADYANRTGIDLLAVTDSMIDGYFAARKVRVQYVYNWQDLADGAVGYPNTADLLVYPAGTFVRGAADVINLDAVYDAASLSVNEMTGLFFEEGVGLAKTCFKVKKVTITVAAGGITGAASNALDFTVAG